MTRASVVLALCAVIGVGAAAQVSRVSVGAAIWTTSGLPVFEIDCGRFELRVDGEARPVSKCTPAPPLAIALLFDVSGSFHYGLPIRNIVREVLDRTSERDRVAVGWFGAETELPAVLTRDRAALDARAARAQRVWKDAAGPSPLWDALAASVKQLRTVAGRPVIIVFSDARATGNLSPFGVSALEIVRSGVEIHAFGAPMIEHVREDLPDQARRLRLWSLARASGGTTVYPGGTFEFVKPSLRTIIDELHRGYVLEFEALPSDIGVRQLEVRIGTPGFVVRAPDRFAVR